MWWEVEVEGDNHGWLLVSNVRCDVCHRKCKEDDGDILRSVAFFRDDKNLCFNCWTREVK